MELKIDQETKICTKCNEYKPLENFYSYEKKSKTKGKYIYYQPKCKDCILNEYKENKDELNKRRTEQSRKNPEVGRKASRKYRKKNIDTVAARQKKWRQEHPDKLSEYGKERRMHKEHDITDQEWLECLEFFKDSCAYCGIPEAEALITYNQRLNMEHVEHDGANDITNCVPACKSCNSTKNIKEFNEWYCENNHIYSKRRYNKIIKWLLSFTK